MSEETAPSGRGKTRVVAGLGALALAVPIVSTARVLPVDVPFVDGIAWLTNESRGEVVQVNGQTGQVEASLGLGAAQDISIAQSEGVAIVQIDGEVRSIDLTSLEWGEAISADGQLVTGAGDDPVVYLVQPDGVALALDPMTLEPRGEVDLAGDPGAGVVAADRLVVPVSTSEDTSIKVVDGNELLGSVAVGAPQDRVSVSRVGDEIAVVNLTQGTLATLDPAGSDVVTGSPTDLEVPAGEVLVPAELPEGLLWLLSVRQGDLLAVDLSSGELEGGVRVADERSDLAGPVVLDDRVFVLNRDTGMVIQVDAETLTEITPQQRLDNLGLEDASDAEILAEGGKVFVNDPGSQAAVVFSDDGTAVQVDKYDEDGPAVPMPASDFAADRDDADEEGDTAPDDGPADDEPSDQSGGQDDNREATEANDEPPSPPANPPPSLELPELPEVPVTTPQLPTPTTAAPRSPSPASTSPSTTSTTSTTTTSTTTTTVPPAPVAPGGIALSATPSDGQIALSWTEAASASPVTYNISSDRAIGNENAWTTTDLSRTFTGLNNGEAYSFTVTPSNEAGNGPPSSASGVPVGRPTVSGSTATPAGRDLNVTFSYNLNGSQLQSCTVTDAGGSPVQASCANGSGSATVTVPNYNSTHTFTVEVVTSTGTATQPTPAATTEAKPLTVDGSAARWAGSCYYQDGKGTSRPVTAAPTDACVDTGPDYYERMAANGSSQRVLCYRNDVVIQDDLGNESGIWLQLDDGWMNALYFTDWGSAHDNLPQC